MRAGANCSVCIPLFQKYKTSAQGSNYKKFDENEDAIEDEDPDPDDDGDEVLLQKQCWCNGRRLKYERAAKFVHISQGQTAHF